MAPFLNGGRSLVVMLFLATVGVILLCGQGADAVHRPLPGSDNGVFRFQMKDNHEHGRDNNNNGLEPDSLEDVTPTCGYKSCNLGKPGMINVHLVPHTHDDVGWLKTVDQYYYGAHNEIQHAGVQYILDTVTEVLLKDDQKRFIYVEIAFFYRWWQEQTDAYRHLVKGLVNQGRLEFILGGWSMNDEACTHYNAIIDQHTLGFHYLNKIFGECARPKIGWQIDPFGHSREQASLFAQFGFDGLFFGRLDYQDKLNRLKEKTMEMMWLGSENLGQASFLLTGVLRDGYGPPMSTFPRTPVMDDPRMEDYNVPEKVQLMIKASQQQAGNYTTNHILMTMGSDFQFENAHENFKNLDKLIKYVNAEQLKGSNVNLLYSTPSCYLYALNQANQTYTTKSDDFFPYASRAHSFWSGYFTSRPALKGYVRKTNNLLQVCKQLHVLSNLGTKFEGDLDILRRAMGIAQHHDAVSGTSKQAVADDYAKLLAKGVSACEDIIDQAYSNVLPRTSTPAPGQIQCQLLNASNCDVTEENNKFTVIAYNPIGREVKHWVRLPVTGKSYVVQDSSLATLASQVVPLSQETLNLPDHNGSKAVNELIFKVTLPPLGYSTFFVSESADNIKNGASRVWTPEKDFDISNKHLRLSFSGQTGMLNKFTLPSGVSLPVHQTLMYYTGMKGNNSSPERQASGAYIFRPNGSNPIPIAPGNTAKTSVVLGHQAQEVHQKFSDWASQVIRLYNDSKYAEVEWTIGPIPFRDGIGREVISQFEMDLATDKTFYTDANGREILQRIRNYRETWSLNQTEPVAGNYYPVNSRMFIMDKDKDLQFTLLNDRSQGGASLKDGQIELMLHRRLFVDDGYGVGEALNESGITGEGLVVRGKQYLFLDSIKSSAQKHRDLGEHLFMAPLLSFSPLTSSPEDYLKLYKSDWSNLATPLPDNVHLLTLEKWEGNSFLLRLEHFYEKDEDSELSKPVTVSLKNLFKNLVIKNVEELTLGANQKLSEATRLRWNVQGHGYTDGKMADFVEPFDRTSLSIKLNPMQIRTFQVFY